MEVRMKQTLFLALVFCVGLNQTAFARGGNEDGFMVSNGQGISSPSYWNGIEGQNPAGIVANSSMKLQLGGGSFSGTDQPYGSGGLLLGNGMVGAGVEYLSKSAAGSSNGQINWGLGGRIQSLGTSIGVSSRFVMGGASVYDAGILVEPNSRFRFGLMVPHVNTTIDTFGSGITIALDNTVDFVVDADYSSVTRGGIAKPGLTFRSQSLQATLAYGLAYKTGVTTGGLLNDSLNAGLGAKIGNSMMFSYEYRGVVDHRVGLTIRLN
jgi:hypothetical protein